MEKQQMKPTVNIQNIQPKSAKVKQEQYSLNGWDFTFSTGGIMPSDDLDQISDYLILNISPDVVFGSNIARIENKALNFVYEVNPVDSLRFCNFKARENRLIAEQSQLKTKSPFVNHINVIPKEVKVKQASVWKNKKVDPEIQAEIKPIEQFSDCFFSTGYKGTVKKSDLELKNEKEFFRQEANTKINLEETVAEGIYPYVESTTEEIPVHNLTEKNPIQWSSMIHMWEDELGDNGDTSSEFRFRVMKDCFFGLIRHYLRLDDVMIRIYDTRIYHDFSYNYILREFTIREDSYPNIQKKGFQFTPKWMCEQGQSYIVNQYVDQVYSFKDKIFIGPQSSNKQ